MFPWVAKQARNKQNVLLPQLQNEANIICENKWATHERSDMINWAALNFRKFKVAQ